MFFQAEVLGNKKEVRTMKLYEYKRKVDATFQPFSRYKNLSYTK